MEQADAQTTECRGTGDAARESGCGPLDSYTYAQLKKN